MEDIGEEDDMGNDMVDNGAEPLSKDMETQCEIRKSGRCPCDRPWMVDAEVQCTLPDISIWDLKDNDKKTRFYTGKLVK